MNRTIQNNKMLLGVRHTRYSKYFNSDVHVEGGQQIAPILRRTPQIPSTNSTYHNHGW
eukprot:SAG11_NODE_1660_length_4498_cov_5.293021_5_plen_58_part_00